ncbi:tetratricopeptide repeat protein [Nocardiopsis salina]|uniref:tetratricopeptide repeat protein n=1 Tax=Nocardiopsis salina TaxID=245836 RepID=UPI00034C4BBD|nr:tetratricopeptide repeat protein [Nocardiopsis salina]
MQPSDFSPNSAVDLGARKAAMEREAKQRAAESTGRTNPYAVNIDESNFQTEVLERSVNLPVVLAVLAGWSEQSSQVEAALDNLSLRSGGNWYLAKVDSEASPRVTQALQVQSAPAILVAIQGQVMPLAQGPATEEQLREGLGQVFAALAQQGMLPEGHSGTVEAEGEPAADAEEGEPEPQGRPVDNQAQEALDRGDFAAAEEVYSKAVEADPSDTESKSRLAQVGLVGRLQDVDPESAMTAAQERPDDVDAQLVVADMDIYRGQAEDAFERLIATVKRTSGDERERVRARLLALFDVLPPGDPRVNTARRKLTAALF